eukprot:1159298-Pelagomonas_calceolata.AAC.2
MDRGRAPMFGLQVIQSPRHTPLSVWASLVILVIPSQPARKKTVRHVPYLHNLKQARIVREPLCTQPCDAMSACPNERGQVLCTILSQPTGNTT